MHHRPGLKQPLNSAEWPMWIVRRGSGEWSYKPNYWKED